FSYGVDGIDAFSGPTGRFSSSTCTNSTNQVESVNRSLTKTNDNLSVVACPLLAERPSDPDLDGGIPAPCLLFRKGSQVAVLYAQHIVHEPDVQIDRDRFRCRAGEDCAC